MIKALAAALVVLVMFLSPILGFLVQPWAPWYLEKDSFSLTPQPAPGFLITTPTPVPGAPTPTLGVWQDIGRVISAAYTWLGVPYLWGGCTRQGTDCSCLMLNVYAVVGIHLPRTTVQQQAATRPIPREQIQAGDLVFFNNTCTGCGPNPTHVGLSIGGGLMIQAGDPVQVSSITTGFYNAHYASAGRVVQ